VLGDREQGSKTSRRPVEKKSLVGRNGRQYKPHEPPSWASVGLSCGLGRQQKYPGRILYDPFRTGERGERVSYRGGVEVEGMASPSAGSAAAEGGGG